MRRTANSGIYDQKRDAENELKEVRARVEKFEAHGLVEYLNFLEGKYEYAVIDKYRYEIIKLDEKFCSCDRVDLAAVSFRSTRNGQQKRNNGSLYIHQYSDDSGSNYKMKAFPTLDEAKEYLIGLVESGEVKPVNVNLGDLFGQKKCKYPITSPKIEAFIAEQKQKNDEYRQKEIDKKKKEITKLEAGN